MPSTKVHRLVAKMIGGSDKVNHVIDLPFVFAGRGHRKYFHTQEEAATIGYAVGGRRGAAVGLAHILTDELGSSDKTIRLLMELAAENSEKRRSRKR